MAPLDPHRGPDELLNAYGFEGMTDPDPVGNNLQGTIGNLAEQPDISAIPRSPARP